jgi:hypothetical protein
LTRSKADALRHPTDPASPGSFLAYNLVHA